MTDVVKGAALQVLALHLLLLLLLLLLKRPLLRQLLGWCQRNAVGGRKAWEERDSLGEGRHGRGGFQGCVSCSLHTVARRFPWDATIVATDSPARVRGAAHATVGDAAIVAAAAAAVTAGVVAAAAPASGVSALHCICPHICSTCQWHTYLPTLSLCVRGSCSSALLFSESEGRIVGC